MSSALEEILAKFRAGDEEAAFYALLELPGEWLPALIAQFRAESESHIRALLIKVAWERKEAGVIPFLAEALTVADELVWQQALDGLVAFASEEVRAILSSARSLEFADPTLTNRFRLWVEEALHQVEFEIGAKV